MILSGGAPGKSRVVQTVLSLPQGDREHDPTTICAALYVLYNSPMVSPVSRLVSPPAQD